MKEKYYLINVIRHLNFHGVKWIKLGKTCILPFTKYQIKKWKSMAQPGLLKNLENEICAITEIEANDRDQAYQKGKFYVSKIISVLRLFLDDSYSGRVRVLIDSDPLISPPPDYSLPNISGRPSHTHWTQIGILDRSRVKEFRGEKLKKICNLCDKRDLSELENSLISAIEWFSIGLLATHKAQQYVCYVTALETLVTEHSNEKSIRSQIAERVPFIYWKRRQDTDTRLNLSKRMRDIYDKRSKILHSGHLSINDKELREVNSISRYCIKQFIPMLELGTKRELKEWIEKKRFSF